MSTIALEHPDQPDVHRLIEALDNYQRPLYPAASHHGIPMSALAQPHVLFAVLRTDTGQAIGCGAVVLNPSTGPVAYGEIKRMFVQPWHRGQGLARQLCEFLEAQAQARGCPELALETGIYQSEALALYARAGFEPCEPFGDYQPDPLSVFMRKRLA
jgi:putative acetyltransferase